MIHVQTVHLVFWRQSIFFTMQGYESNQNVVYTKKFKLFDFRLCNMIERHKVQRFPKDLCQFIANFIGFYKILKILRNDDEHNSCEILVCIALTFILKR
jgi:hypothetical protein